MVYEVTISTLVILMLTGVLVGVVVGALTCALVLWAYRTWWAECPDDVDDYDHCSSCPEALPWRAGTSTSTDR